MSRYKVTTVREFATTDDLREWMKAVAEGSSSFIYIYKDYEMKIEKVSE